MRLLLIACGLMFWFLGWELATVIAARQLAPTSLGVPWCVISSWSFYYPWEWMRWVMAFGQHVPGVLKPAQVVGYGTCVGSMLLLGCSRFLPGKKLLNISYGSARWSTTKELRAAGLGDTGVVLCQTDAARYCASIARGAIRWEMKAPGELICDNSDGHVLCLASTGSGKGAGIVVPTLLSTTDSVVVYDPKGENWQITAGWRAQFSHVIRFEPTNPNSAQYNPLFAVPRGEGDVREAQNIAEVLVPKDEKGKRDHWQLTAYKLLVGAILHVLYAGEKKDLSGVLELLTDPTRPIREVLEMMMRTNHLGNRPHPQVVSAARAALNKSDNELSGVVSTAETCLDLWLDPLVARNTSRSDFCAEQLNSLDTPVSLFLVVPTRDIERLRPLVRLMIIQIGNRLTGQIDKPSVRSSRRFYERLVAAFSGAKAVGSSGKRRVTFILDEFPTIGYLPWIESAIAYLRGYKIKLLLIVQSFNQLEKVYGPNHAFIDNSWARVTYTAFDERTARRISELLGQRTEVQERESRSKRRGSLFFDNVSQSQQEHARPLMTPGEVLTLPYDDAIVFAGGLNGYRGKKIMYYLDDRFAGRANMPIPDSPEQQAAELPQPLPASEWRALMPIVAAPPAPTPPTAADAATTIFGAEDEMAETFAEDPYARDAEAGRSW